MHWKMVGLDDWIQYHSICRHCGRLYTPKKVGWWTCVVCRYMNKEEVTMGTVQPAPPEEGEASSQYQKGTYMWALHQASGSERKVRRAAWVSDTRLHKPGYHTPHVLYIPERLSMSPGWRMIWKIQTSVQAPYPYLRTERYQPTEEDRYYATDWELMDEPAVTETTTTTTTPQPEVPQCCGTCRHRTHIRLMGRPEWNWTECLEKPSPGKIPDAYTKRGYVNGVPYTAAPMGVQSGTTCPCWENPLT